MKCQALLILLIVVAMTNAQAEMYRWVDERGKVHYGDQPPAAAKDVQQKKLGGNYIESDQLPFATKQAARNYPVTLYANDCQPCNIGRALLAKRGVPYSQRNPEASPQELEALKKLTGSAEIPVLVVGSMQPVKGFEEGAWNTALDAAGYPKSNPGVTQKGGAPVKPPSDQAANEASVNHSR